MRLVRWRASDGAHLGRVEGEEIVDLGSSGPVSAVEALASGHRSDGPRHALTDVQILAPVLPGKIIAIGLNYRDHAEETGVAIPERPLIFAKFPSSIVGPYDDVELLDGTTELDYEGELGVVVGHRCRHVPEADALAQVAGVVVANDVSARDAQFADVQWVRGKSFDTFSPIGPWLQSLDSTGEVDALDVSTWVNGELRQKSNTKNLIFPIAFLVAYCSRYFTLDPGDLILTGTPGGVGFSMNPPRYLADGDIVEIEVGGVGRIRNRIARATAEPKERQP